MRLAIAAAILLAFPAGASAAVTRPVQAVDGIGTHYWVPNALAAQQGDTIEWRFTQPGNTSAAQHDVWIVPPGGSPTQGSGTKRISKPSRARRRVPATGAGGSDPATSTNTVCPRTTASTCTPSSRRRVAGAIPSPRP